MTGSVCSLTTPDDVGYMPPALLIVYHITLPPIVIEITIHCLRHRAGSGDQRAGLPSLRADGGGNKDRGGRRGIASLDYLYEKAN